MASLRPCRISSLLGWQDTRWRIAGGPVRSSPAVHTLKGGENMKGDQRNHIKHILAALLVTAALAGLACGTAATATPSAKGTPTGPTATATARSTPAPRVGETTLRVGMPFVFTNQPADPVKGGGFQLIQMGLGETLLKLGKDLRPEPWLAAS